MHNKTHMDLRYTAMGLHKAVKIIKRFQSKVLRLIVSAPWYVSHSSKKKFTDCQHSTIKSYSDTITDKSQKSATHQTSEEDWGDSGRLTYHNPQTKKDEVIIFPPQGLYSTQDTY
jgi:hypothetical protein